MSPNVDMADADRSILLKPTEVTNKVTVKQIGPLHWTQHKEQMKQLSCDLIIF